VIHLLIFKPVSQFTRDVTRPVVREQTRFVPHGCLITRVIPPEIKGLHKYNFLGMMNEEISNEDKQIH
jgi:hypothetical protein